ncbi:hypothetical protein R3P38DRAFT_2813563 [Favolaschia claudopus]|uniref:Uncharacterized protein n=1 Tax=Favolaschia claudopus TaxID=2862362 RepID=A0AAV9Z562_9AGAR
MGIEAVWDAFQYGARDAFGWSNIHGQEKEVTKVGGGKDMKETKEQEYLELTDFKDTTCLQLKEKPRRLLAHACDSISTPMTSPIRHPRPDNFRLHLRTQQPRNRANEYLREMQGDTGECKKMEETVKISLIGTIQAPVTAAHDTVRASTRCRRYIPIHRDHTFPALVFSPTRYRRPPSRGPTRATPFAAALASDSFFRPPLPLPATASPPPCLHHPTPIYVAFVHHQSTRQIRPVSQNNGGSLTNNDKRFVCRARALNSLSASFRRVATCAETSIIDSRNVVIPSWWDYVLRHVSRSPRSSPLECTSYGAAHPTTCHWLLRVRNAFARPQHVSLWGVLAIADANASFSCRSHDIRLVTSTSHSRLPLF